MDKFLYLLSLIKSVLVRKIDKYILSFCCYYKTPFCRCWESVAKPIIVSYVWLSAIILSVRQIGICRSDKPKVLFMISIFFAEQYNRYIL